MNTFTVRGEAAQLRWGYHVAATLGPWTIDGTSLVAQVRDVNTFRVSQSPVMFVVGSVIRPLEGLQIANGTLTARLGSREP